MENRRPQALFWSARQGRQAAGQGGRGLARLAGALGGCPIPQSSWPFAGDLIGCDITLLLVLPWEGEIMHGSEPCACRASLPCLNPLVSSGPECQ